jgi:tetratricopeptide (TPR) repeat protein
MKNYLGHFQKLHFVLLICVAGVCSVASASTEDDALTVAISEFTMQGGTADQSWIATSSAEALTNKIAGQKSIRIVERQYLSKIIDELKLQASGLVDENTAVEVGNLVGVKYFIYGSVSIANDALVLRTRTVDVKTTQVISSAEATGALSDIFKIQNELAQKVSMDLSFGTITISENDPSRIENLPFSVASKLEKLKKLAAPLPFFYLDPARKRKSAEYMLAINICDDLIEKYPKLEQAHYYRGLFSIHSEDFTTADDESKTAKQLNPDDVEAFLLRGFCFFVSEKYTEAGQVLNYASTKFPFDSRVWYALAKLDMKQNNTIGAMECFINSMNTGPYLPQAEDNFRSLVTSNQFYAGQFSAEMYFDIATMYKTLYGAGKVINANTNSLAVKTAASAPGFAISYYIMGLYETAQGNRQAAQNDLYKAIQQKPLFSEAHRALGIVCLEMGQCGQGRQHIAIYTQTNNAISDFSELQNKMNRCR